LFYNKREQIDINDLRNSLTERGIQFEEHEINKLFNSLKFLDNTGDTLSRLEIFANAHLFKLDKNSRFDLLRKIAIGCGTGLNDHDLKLFEKMSHRLHDITELANDRNCSLYVDAEQTYMQAAIESFGQQLSQKYNVGSKNIILNGYQCYLKRMKGVIEHEVQAAEKLGYNLTLKLIRGAYLSEERELAEKFGVESPVHDTLENTHNCYNDCLKLAIQNSNSKSVIFLASHNQDSIELAKSLIYGKGINDYRVRFGQLKGFADQITGQLSQEDFKTYKYLPFGPTEHVMPYLVRRGQESK